MTTARITAIGLVLLFVGCADEFADSPDDPPETVDEPGAWQIDEEAPASSNQPEPGSLETGDESPSPPEEPEPAAHPDDPAQPVDILNCPGEAVSPDCEQDLVVHEWGTFTSVVGSDGQALEGLHHEEESLPEFVHRFGTRVMQPTEPALTGKGLNVLPEPVTQKMETPVIYFYTPEAKKVDVSVQFPEGIVSEWYPDASHHHGADSWNTEIADGGADWTVDITNEPRSIPEVPADDIWAPSREVPDAAWVQHEPEQTWGQQDPETESEKLIFYRGVGNFEPPFTVRHDGARYELANYASDQVPEAFLLEVDDDEGRIHSLGSVGGFDSLEHDPDSLDEQAQPLDAMVAEAKTRLTDALVDTGLTVDEARAMVDTWEESYFRTPGNRILYVLPRAWTETVLPIDVEPKPDDLVRTLVGRLEVLTEAEEQQIVDEIETVYDDPDSGTWDLTEHRFSEPRIRRGCDLIEDDDIEQWCLDAADQISKYPELNVEW